MNANNMKTALTIAGSDSCGGAGIQADIKTMTMNGVYAMSAITALTAQNTTGVRAISEVTPEFLGQQLDAVFEAFYRLDDARATNTGGAGLGLAIAKSFTELQGGELTLELDGDLFKVTTTWPVQSSPVSNKPV